MTENLLPILLSAVLCENFVLTRLLGLETALGGQEKTSLTIIRGILTAVCMTVSGMIAVAVFSGKEMQYLIPVVFAVILSAMELVCEPVLAKFFHIESCRTRIFLNSAVFAVILHSADCTDWQEAAVFGAASGIGLILVSCLICWIRERLETSDIPESFRDLPVLILSAGLCAMVFTGFAGLSF